MIAAMGAGKMHADEVETDVTLVRRLLAGQFPLWADLPIGLVDSYGTDHDIYRLGEDLSARLPRIGWATRQAAKEAEWLPKMAPHLPLAVPVPLAVGHPAEGYPYDWSVYAWLPGSNANGTIDDLEQAAVDLAGFIRALRGIDTAGAHERGPRSRGAPLASSMSSFAGRSPSWVSGSMARRCCGCGRSRSTLQCGMAQSCGCTVICSRATCSWWMVASRRSSTSVV